MRRIFAGIGSTMASSSPETAPSLIHVGESPSSNSSNSNPSAPPPAEAASSPPPQSPPQSPPPVTTPPTSSPPSSPPPSSPPPASPSPSSPPPASPPPAGNNSPPAQSQSPPPNNSPPPSSNSPPPARYSPPAPVFSPPPPGTGDSQSPPSPASSRPPPSPPRSGGDKSSGSSSVLPESDNSPPSSDSISPGTVAAIIFGGVAIVALLIVCVIYARRRKKRPKYYMDPGHSPKGGNQYYNSNAQWNNRPQPLDVPGKLPPPPGGWGTPGPPPPPPTNNSSEYSSGYSAAQRHTPPSPNMGGFGSQSQFTYEELAYATGGFTQANLLGQGGFGLVHKGVLPGGREVAVKSLKSGSGQGEREFQAEVEIISRVHHRHLVSLVGYCIADGQKMLVYEFVPNKTLEFHLHGKGQPVMEWATRLRLALGSAKGLAYLHEDCHPRIIHRDIKAANILIDINFEAMVADFGLAKLTTDNNTHVSTRVMGTFGYLAPEYASSGKLSEKSDVFSFGVMLLELITGRRPVDPHDMMEDSLVDWARPLLTRAQDQGIYEELVDPRLEDQFVPREMARMVACAAASIRHSARRRPKMSQIVRALEGDSSLEDLNEIVKPSQGVASKNTEIYDTRAYDADMLKFRQMVMMTSQEFNSSEYGLNPSSSSSDSRETGKSTPDLQK